MALVELKQEIEKAAKYEADKILKAAEKEADSIMDDSEQKIAASRKESKESLKQIEAALERRELAGARFEAKKAMLDMKKNIVDEVFRKVNASLAKMNEAKRRQIIKTLLQKASEELKLKYVYCNKNDKRLIPKPYKAIEGDMLGGIIGENEEKTTRVDYSFDTLLQQLKEEKLEEITKITF